jgi:hypothetical protein
LDKPRYNKLLHTVKFLKPYIISKLQSIKDNIEIDTRSSYGLDYINKNFVFNKRYFDIRKNKIYYKTLCILYIKIAYCTIKWYRDTIKKTYEPGGRGYFEAKERFTSNF